MGDPGPACYSPQLDAAIALATDAFRSERRKGTQIPYLCHLLQVMVWVGERGGSEDQMIAAVLHDYLEDVEGSTEAELAGLFGAEVASMVVALSDATELPKPPWKERKVAYLEVLRDEPDEVKLISACDKLHNATSILRDFREVGDALWGRFKGGKDGTLWYYREVVQALAEGWEHPVVGELQTVVDTMLSEAGATAPPR